MSTIPSRRTWDSAPSLPRGTGQQCGSSLWECAEPLRSLKVAQSYRVVLKVNQTCLVTLTATSSWVALVSTRNSWLRVVGRNLIITWLSMACRLCDLSGDKRCLRKHFAITASLHCHPASLPWGTWPALHLALEVPPRCSGSTRRNCANADPERHTSKGQASIWRFVITI